MAIPRFWWLDDTDADRADERLAAVRRQLEKWTWIRWDESAHESPSDALRDLETNLLISPTFEAGKVITCHGIPKCHSKIAKQLDEIPEKVLLVLVARPDTKTTLYKTAKGLDFAKVDEPLTLRGRDAAVTWVSEKATKAGFELDRDACRMLVDFVGTNPGRLSMELKKACSLAGEGKVYPWAVQQSCHGYGMADVREMCQMMASGNYEGAHEYMDRLLARGEPPLKICGYLIDWCRKMAMAESCNGQYDSIKPQVASLKKYQKPTKDNPVGSAVPMFPKPGALYFSCKTYNEIGGKRFWAAYLLQRLGKIQLSLRGGGAAVKDPARIMQNFITEFRGLRE